MDEYRAFRLVVWSSFVFCRQQLLFAKINHAIPFSQCCFNNNNVVIVSKNKWRLNYKSKSSILENLSAWIRPKQSKLTYNARTSLYIVTLYIYIYVIYSDVIYIYIYVIYSDVLSLLDSRNNSKNMYRKFVLFIFPILYSTLPIIRETRIKTAHP